LPMSAVQRQRFEHLHQQEIGACLRTFDALRKEGALPVHINAIYEYVSHDVSDKDMDQACGKAVLILVSDGSWQPRNASLTGWPVEEEKVLKRLLLGVRNRYKTMSPDVILLRAALASPSVYGIQACGIKPEWCRELWASAGAQAGCAPAPSVVQRTRKAIAAEKPPASESVEDVWAGLECLMGPSGKTVPRTSVKRSASKVKSTPGEGGKRRKLQSAPESLPLPPVPFLHRKPAQEAKAAKAPLALAGPPVPVRTRTGRVVRVPERFRE